MVGIKMQLKNGLNNGKVKPKLKKQKNNFVQIEIQKPNNNF